MTTLARHNGNHEKIRVLFYHRIGSDSEEPDPSAITIPQSVFRAQLALLEKWGYASITFQDYALYMQGVLSLPKKPVIITFDDGYHDLHTYALPVMQEFGMRGVIFVVGDRQMRTNTWDTGIARTYTLLSDEEILEFHSAGFEIGVHSMHHRPLTAIAASEAWEEIHQARIATEILLNAPAMTFSYPYGLLNGELKKMAREAGYTVACAAYTGPATFGRDALEVRRIKMTDSANPLAFWLKLQPAYAYYRCLWGRCKDAVSFIIRPQPKAWTPAAVPATEGPQASLWTAYGRAYRRPIHIVTPGETRS